MNDAGFMPGHLVSSLSRDESMKKLKHFHD